MLQSENVILNEIPANVFAALKPDIREVDETRILAKKTTDRNEHDTLILLADQWDHLADQ